MGNLPDTNEVEDRPEFELIPPGSYRGVVEQSEIVTTAKGFPMLKLTCTVIDGEFEGRKIWDNIILRHDSEKAEQIGLRKLKQLKVAVGKPQSTQEEDLWDVPVTMKVAVEKDKTGNYGDKNRIVEFKPDGGTVKTAPPVKTATPPPGEGPKRSWRK